MSKPDRQRVAEYMAKDYSVLLRRLTERDGGGWLAEIRELPGCMSDGGTRELALENLREAQEAWLTTALEEGFEIPGPRFVTDEFSGRLTLRIPKSMHAKLSEMAEDEEVSLNQLIVTLLAQRSATYGTVPKKHLATAVHEPRPHR